MCNWRPISTTPVPGNIYCLPGIGGLLTPRFSNLLPQFPSAHRNGCLPGTGCRGNYDRTCDARCCQPRNVVWRSRGRHTIAHGCQGYTNAQACGHQGDDESRTTPSKRASLSRQEGMPDGCRRVSLSCNFIVTWSHNSGSVANKSLWLRDSYSKGGWVTHIKLIPQASALESDATDVYDKIKV